MPSPPMLITDVRSRLKDVVWRGSLAWDEWIAVPENARLVEDIEAGRSRGRIIARAVAETVEGGGEVLVVRPVSLTDGR